MQPRFASAAPAGMRGFTLLEIVVAVGILGVSVAVAMQIFSSGFQNLRRIELAHRAMNHAENVMNELLSDDSLDQPARFSGDLDEEFRYTAQVDYWEEEREQLALDASQPGGYLLGIEVNIHFKNDRRGKRYRTVCLKALREEGAPSGAATPGDTIRQLFGPN